ncbi:MAG: PKD domain-containing protein [Bacteroidota bacterium]
MNSQKIEELDISGCGNNIPNPHFLAKDINVSGEYIKVLYAVEKNPALTYTWDFNSEGSSREPSTGDSVHHYYGQAGYYNVSLTVSNSAGDCKVRETRVIRTISQFDLTTRCYAYQEQGCDTLITYLNYRPKGPTDNPDLKWVISNGDVYTGNSPRVVFDQVGSYDVTLFTSTDTLTQKDLVLVTQSPDATFSWVTKDDTSVLRGSYEVIFSSVPQFYKDTTYRYTWNFTGNDSKLINSNYIPSNNENVLMEHFVFPDTGYFYPTVRIFYYIENGVCESTSTSVIHIKNDLLLDLNSPNLVVKNNSNYNSFGISSNGVTPLNLKVFSRAGTLIYEETNISLEWNLVTPHNINLSPGIYYYIITAEDGSIKPKINFFQVFEE